MKQQWEMCTVKTKIRLDQNQQKLLKMGAVDMLKFGERYYMPKYYASNGVSEKEFSNQDDAIEYLLQEGWEPFSIITTKDDDYIYHFRRKTG